MAVKGPKGEEYKYSYDFFGKLNRFTNPLGESLKFFYNKGNISKLVDENGAETLFEYDNNCNVKTVTDPDGVVTVYEYDSLNRVTATITADGARTTYEYDEADRIVRTRDALGNTREYTYDRGGKVLSVKEADGTVRSCQRNVMGKVTEVTDEQGRKTLISYNAGGKQEQVTLPNGGIVRYEYDPLMRLIRQTDPEGRTITLSYDPNGNVIAERIGEREAVTLEYDALNRVISSTDALGNTRSYDYDENGKLICLTDPLGNKFTREYDLLGRVTKETDPLGNSTVYTYRAGGNIQTVTDAAGCVRRFEYTVGGKLREVYFCDKLEQRLTYDVAGRISRRSFPDGYEISYTYDALSRFSKVQASDGRTVSYEYDAMGRVVRLSDVGSTTLYTYTPSGRLKSVVDALGNETAYTYDALDNLAGIHRAEGLISKEERDGELFPTVGRDGHVTLFSYNLAGQLTGKTDALGQQESFSYDQYGRLIEKTDRDNYKTSYGYDPNGQVNSIGYADGRSVEFAYDALGRLDSFTDWLGRTTVERDALGRVTSVLDYNSNKVSYTYGPLSQRTSITYPDGNRVDYIYDDRLRLKELVSGEEKTSYLYDEFDRLIEKKLPNADRQVMTYLQGGRLGTLEMYDPQGMLDKYIYGYDEQGNRNTIDRLRRDLQDISGRYSYEYDPEKRLTKALFNDNLLRSYEYDAFGNRTRLMEGDTETTYSYDVLDRLVERKQQNSGLDRVMSYEYDRRGNQTKEFVDGLLNKAFDFDATNMLTKVTDVSKGDAFYGYNGLGNRVSVESPEKKVDYLLDLTKRYHNMLERSVDGEAERYIYDSNVVSMSRAGESYFYLQDELGSGMYLTGTNGMTAEAYAYDEFGRNLNPHTGKREKHGYTKTGNIIQPLAFTGYQQDEMSGRYYAQARYYDPETGRFVSKDKDKFVIKATPITHNLYTYCGNNAIMNIDPDGHESLVISGGPADKDTFDYQFIETAIRDIRDQISAGTDPDDITWIVMNAGYTPTDIINFNDTASQLGVNIVVANGKEDLIDYINDKNGDRSDDPITRASFYCHGRNPRRVRIDENELSFAYNIKDVDQSKFSFTQSDIARLNADAFDNTVTYFYSCNSGTNDSSNTSFAQEWSNKTGGRSLGLKNARSLYAFINSTGNFGIYTGPLGHKAIAPADLWNYFLSRIGKPTLIWEEKQKRHDRNDNGNGKGYSEYGSLQYPWMVSLAGEFDGMEDWFNRKWVWFEPETECEG